MAVVLPIGVFLPTAANAADREATSVSESDIEAAIAVVEDVRPHLLADPIDVVQSRETMVAVSDVGTRISLPDELSEGIKVATSHGPTIGLSVPGASSAETAEILSNGPIAYPAADASCASAAAATEDREVQVLTTIADDMAPERFEYALDLPQGATLSIDEKTGGGVARDASGAFLLAVAPAWAIAGDGEKVPTRYEVNGHSLVQVVEHRGRNLSYPVVADPWLGGDLIQRWKWYPDGSGYKISVAVTALGALAGIASIAAFIVAVRLGQSAPSVFGTSEGNWYWSLMAVASLLWLGALMAGARWARTMKNARAGRIYGGGLLLWVAPLAFVGAVAVVFSGTDVGSAVIALILGLVSTVALIVGIVLSVLAFTRA